MISAVWASDEFIEENRLSAGCHLPFMNWTGKAMFHENMSAPGFAPDDEPNQLASLNELVNASGLRSLH